MKKLLFWKGRGHKNVLETFLEGMTEKYDIIYFPFEYDSGEPPFSPDSEWSRWLIENPCDTWCGISLGASLMYAMAAVSDRFCPSEMILINPFISRYQLSKEKGFSLAGQWELELRNKPLTLSECNIVLSVHDEKINIHHGIELAGQITASKKKVLFLDSDHCLDSEKIQKDLSDILNGKEGSYAAIDQYRHIHQRN